MGELNSFVVYNDNQAYYMLDDEQLGKLFRGMLDYSRGLDPGLTENSPEFWVFQSVRASMDAHAKKYAEKCSRNAENGRRGGLAKARNANASERYRMLANASDSSERYQSLANANGSSESSLPYPYPEPFPNPEPEPERGSAQQAKAKERKRFEKPTAEQVDAYASESGLTIDAQRFIDHYESNGWKVGRNPMKDWKSAVRNWCRNDFNAKKAVSADDLSEYNY